jgi:hypothetical protein
MKTLLFSFILTITLVALLSCKAGIPTPQGGSVTSTEAGIQTCITWAQEHCTACAQDASGIQTFVDASGGK